MTAILGGSGSLAATGGTVILSGANTYTGATNIQTGTLQAGAPNIISTASAVTVNGTFNMAGYSQSVGSVDGAGIIAMGNATLTAGSNNGSTLYSGTITGTGSIVKTGTGTWILSGTGNTYTGGTTILGGILQLGASVLCRPAAT